MSKGKFGFGSIVIDSDGVHIDGHKLDGLGIMPELIVKRGGENSVGDTLTLTLASSNIKITDAAKALPSAHIIEHWGEQ